MTNRPTSKSLTGPFQPRVARSEIAHQARIGPCTFALKASLRQTENVPDHLLAHLSPLGWEHINLTGDYIWIALKDASQLRRIEAAVHPARGI
jgi:hypothetical protein